MFRQNPSTITTNVVQRVTERLHGRTLVSLSPDELDLAIVFKYYGFLQFVENDGFTLIKATVEPSHANQ